LFGEKVDKSPIIKKPAIEEIEKHKSKHKKHQTVCSDKRRMPFNCGVCGSENVIEQGVRFCENCGIEQEYLSDHIFWHKFPFICDCHWKHKNYLFVKKCIDCGAVEAKTCPACHNRCWTSSKDLRIKYCKSCGFREDNV
jgi:hypothetical protein